MRAVDAALNSLTGSSSAGTAGAHTDGRAGASPAIRDAATVILVSDRPDLHVLMLERTGRAVFGPGATVFPGGAVDDDDRDARSLALVRDLDERAASAEHGLSSGGLGFRVAAVRESFEEAGILLARDGSNGLPVDHDDDLAEARAALNAGEIAFADVLERRNLVLAARDIRLFSHWLTPVGAPRRYNTWFFVARAPEGEDGAHDDNELVASGWVRPLDALEHHTRGVIDLIFPTEMSLRALASYECTDDLLRDLDDVERDDAGRPFVVPDGTGERVALPADGGRARGRWTIPLPDISFRAERAATTEGR